MDFPGGPMVKTLYSGHRFNGQEIFQMLCGTAKKKKSSHQDVLQYVNG